MLYLLETTAVSDFMAEKDSIVKKMASLGKSDKLVTCSIVRGEILFGLRRMAPGRRRDQLQDRLRVLLEAIPCLAVPAASADYYAAIKHGCELRGVIVGESDLWIASTAKFFGAVLITRDRDFGRIQDLPLEDWSIHNA